ncbi:uncharacterized protein DUF5019 [Epilithonimonas arachidiradicis]|uniref:Uncharacterized protein DUF5019 n=3 Tax=Epilithonimonas arachidiradicis TaxID=1617282 RepID=A0A420CMZ1_9FLAO|nr:uncharacterized protein DUF5019 [Epilithonimonas arachidiradicis]
MLSYNRFFLAIAVIIGLMSCEDREIVTIDEQSPAVVMDLSTQSLMLDANFPNNQVLTVTWKPASFNVPVQMNYQLEISATENFENSTILGLSTAPQNYISFTSKQINEAVKKIGLVPDVVQKLFFRVNSSTGLNNFQQVSNITSLSIKPYLASPIYNFTDLYLIGAATAGGWDNLATNDKIYPLLKTANANIYTFTGFFKADGFKIIKTKGSWDAQYGLGASAGLLDTSGGSGNITISADGYYKLTINISALTYTLESVPTPTKTYNTISIIGTVNGNYDTDTELVQSSFDPHLWTLKKVKLNAGDFKFRANKNWDVNWGSTAEYFGTATQGGDNIPLTSEWEYDVYFNDSTGAYSLIPIK